MDTPDRRGWTALHVAVTENKLTKEELRLLAKQSKNVDAVNEDGYSPLQLLVCIYTNTIYAFTH